MKTCTRDYNSMMAVLRGQRAFDPIGFAAVPDKFKRGLANKERWYLISAERTQEKIAARLAEIVREGWRLAAHSNAEFAAFRAALTPIVQAILLRSMVTCVFFTFLHKKLTRRAGIHWDHVAKR
jgi:hypothetical protein